MLGALLSVSNRFPPEELKNIMSKHHAIPSQENGPQDDGAARRLTRRELFWVGGAALLAQHLQAAAKDPTHVTLLDFVQDGGDPRILTADLELRRGVTEASMNADFQVRISGVVALEGGGTFGVSPKADPIVLLLTKGVSDTPTGSVEVREQDTGRYKYDGGGRHGDADGGATAPQWRRDGHLVADQDGAVLPAAGVAGRRIRAASVSERGFWFAMVCLGVNRRRKAKPPLACVRGLGLGKLGL
jgi:hypothetical protein